MAKKPSTVVDPDAALIAAIPELLPTRTEGLTIRAWIESLRPFFERARELEQAAKDKLTVARTLRMPESAEEDGALQRFIQSTSTEKKTAEEHWDITAKLFQFHRRLVTARKRATEPLEQAATLAQQLHNSYVDQERRRVEQENERRRQEQERIAREQREADLARLEQQALEAEAQSAELSEREQRFVRLILGEASPNRAAQSAGYKNWETIGPRLMNTPKIQQAIFAAKQAAELRRQAEAKAAQPIQRADIVEERPNVASVGVDRTTKSAEITDERALVDAVCEGRLGIPRDVLIVDQARLNQYARDMGELINRWPGCRLKKSTRTI